MVCRSVVFVVVGWVWITGCCHGGTSLQTQGGIYAKLGYSEEGGLRVVEVAPGGPAEQAGLRTNDVIIEIDRIPVRTLQYPTIVQRLRGTPGTSVQLAIYRRGEVHSMSVMRKAYRR